MTVADLLADLEAEQAALEDLVGPLSDEAWTTPTPSPRWTVADQIAHLTYFDLAAAAAIEDGESFSGLVAELWAAAAAGDEAVDTLTLGAYRAVAPAQLLVEWRTARAALAGAAAGLADDARVAWYGPEMGAKSFLSARLMECWAHGQDVVDALDLSRSATDRLRHVARLGFNTRAWSYRNRGLEPPEDPVRIELSAPSGDDWTFGPVGAAQWVRGDAEEFCLVVVQRRHIEDTAIEATPTGRDWLLKAQAFAGPPTDGPAAASR